MSQGIFARKSLVVATLAASVCGGCNWTGSLGGPQRFEDLDVEMNHIRGYMTEQTGLYRAGKTDQKLIRNNVISARMYAIDMKYTEYENQILRETQLVDFGTRLSSGVLTTVSGLIPAIHTAHTLSETAGLINTLDSAYNDKVLKTQIIQNVLASMRTARHEQAAVIYANMYCSIDVYPFGFAFSDLETYYRAGTFQTGLVRLMQSVSTAEVNAKTNQDANRPAPTPATVADTAGKKAEATSKEQQTTKQQQNPERSCKPDSTTPSPVQRAILTKFEMPPLGTAIAARPADSPQR